MQSKFYVDVGTRIREARERSGLNQREVADACGINRLSIGRIEKGKKNASLMTIGRLALALKVPPAEFFIGVEPDTALLVPAPRVNARPRAKAEIPKTGKAGLRKSATSKVP